MHHPPGVGIPEPRGIAVDHSIHVSKIVDSGHGGRLSFIVWVSYTHWGLHLKGPVYISLFKPLSIVIAVAMGAIFLGDALYLGVVLSLGFYTVIWGKSREDLTRTVAGSEQLPLLLTHTIGDEASSL
ncbi:hypothetical protein Bca52824_007956 [Brassica carinata]|uniref:WAT1-related protein n=1 Tax=Brassica carinata TaxID=52824 RepID=A0A8X7WB16_BRACI|nr:hypothetical protein Bca52824_007956 [Brassica carinata]